MTSPASSRPDKPAQIGKYTVVDRLGRGAMGAVYRCHDPMLNRQVAVKLIASSLDQKDMLNSPWRKSYRDASGSFPPPLRCRTPGILPVFWGLGALI